MVSTYDVRVLLSDILLYSASLGSQWKTKEGKSVSLTERTVTKGPLQQMLDEVQTHCKQVQKKTGPQ
jgi:hypothetical protein